MESIVKESIGLRKESIAFNTESREAGNDDTEFELGGENAWDPDVWHQRGARPKVSIDSISTRKHKLANDLRDLNPEIKIIARKDQYEPQAKVLNAKIKEIQEASVAETINDVTFCQGLSSGFSFMHANVQWKGPDSWEQEVRIEALKNNMAVHYDFSHNNPAFIDMKWGSFESQMSRQKYDDKGYGAIGGYLDFPTDAFNIPTAAGDRPIVVNNYYRIKENPAKLLLLSDGAVTMKGYADDPKVKEALELETMLGKVWHVIDERMSYKPQLEWYLCNGSDIIDERTDMLGKYIPIIPYEGRVIWIRGRKYIVSFIRPLKEPAKLKNYAKSLEVELIALQPLNIWSAPVEAIEDYMEYYQTANTKKWAVLPYNHKSKDGEPIPPPTREQYQGPSNQLAGVFASYDKDLDDVSGQQMLMQAPSAALYPESARALDLKNSQGNHNNFDFIDNFITRSMTYLGIVLLDLIPKLSDEPGEVMVDSKGQKETIKINQEGGVDLTDGQEFMQVRAIVGSASESERKDSNRMLVDLLDKIPAMQNVAHLIANNMDNLKDKDDVVKILKASLPPNVQSMLGDDDPQKVQAENSQLQQQVQELEAQYTQATDLIKSMEIDYKKAIDVQNLKSDTAVKQESIKSATTLTKVEMEQQGKILQDLAQGFKEIQSQIAGLTANKQGATT